MTTTSVSLLDRLRRDGGGDDWRRLVDIYTPWIRGWLARQTGQNDLDDLTQEVLLVVLRKLPEFEHNGRAGAFRAWLRTITANCLRELWKRRRIRPAAAGGSDFQQRVQELEDPHSELSRLWDREHDRHVVRRIQELLRPSFKPRTWDAFERVVLRGEAPEEVARELEMSVGAVYIAKSRVLARIHEEAAGLVDD